MPKFKANDRVKSLNHWDEGRIGKVIDTSNSVVDKSLYYEVILDGDQSSGLYKEEELELLDEM